MAKIYQQGLIAIIMLLASPSLTAALSSLEQIEIETFEEMREVERHQIKIAGKHYTDGNFKVALMEYEKFLTLYPRSPGAPYAQLMWSHCQLHLKHVKKALRDGFQSVIDYWPESKEATIAAYCIGDCYRNMGEVVPAIKAFRQVATDYPGTDLAIRATLDILHFAKLHKDEKQTINILRELTYDWERNEKNEKVCVDASRELAMVHFQLQQFEEGRRALATSYSGDDLLQVSFDFTVKTVQHLLNNEATKPDAVKLADQLIGRLRRDSTEHPDEARKLLMKSTEIHAMLGRKSEVMNTYQEIASRWGRDDRILGLMAGWHLDQGEPDKAIQLYGQYADHVAGQEAIAGLYKQQGKLNEAIAIYSKLIDLNGDNAKTYQGAIAKCYEGLQQWYKAIDMYRQMDGFPDTYISMAKCHRKLHEYDKAISLYEECKVVDRVAAGVSLLIGYTYEEAREKEKAIRTFQLTCKRYPKSKAASRAHSHLQNEYNIHVTLGGAEDE